MTKLKAAWSWICTHWPVVLAAIVGILGFVLGGVAVKELRRPDKRVRRELDAARDGELAARVALDRGTKTAVDAIEKQHATTIAALEGAQREKYEKLRADPRRLAAHLSRLSDPR